LIREGEREGARGKKRKLNTGGTLKLEKSVLGTLTLRNSVIRNLDTQELCY
jgi:hypothetical protein